MTDSIGVPFIALLRLQYRRYQDELDRYEYVNNLLADNARVKLATLRELAEIIGEDITT